MSDLVNLVVELDGHSARFAREDGSRGEIPGIDVGEPAPNDGRTLAWIDDCFGGTWGAEAFAGSNVVARRAGAPVGFATFDARGLRFAWLTGVARERDVGLFGPFGVAPEERGGELGRVLLGRALSALRERGYSRALIPAVGDDGLVSYYAEAAGARVVERFDRDALLQPRARTVVMASGNGTNLQAVIDAAASGVLPVDVSGVVCNDPDAHAIERARRAGVRSVRVMPWRRKEESRADYDARLLEAVASERPELVLLLGWMHLLADSFVRAFPETLNLHPAFLPLDFAHDEVVTPDGTSMPAFRGPHAVRDALAAASRWSGATVHRVTPATDRGPVMARKPLRIEAGEDEAGVMNRLHQLERRVVAAAIVRWRFERPMAMA